MRSTKSAAPCTSNDLKRYSTGFNSGHRVFISCNFIREVVRPITILEQDSPEDKIDGCLCLHPPFSTSKDDVFIA